MTKEELTQKLEAEKAQLAKLAYSMGKYCETAGAELPDDIGQLALDLVTRGPVAVAAELSEVQFDRAVRVLACIASWMSFQRKIEDLQGQLDYLADPVEPRRTLRRDGA